MLKPAFWISIVIKRIEVSSKSLHNKIVKREIFLDTFVICATQLAGGLLLKKTKMF